MTNKLHFDLLGFYESHFGLTPSILQRLGAFTVAWGIFENQLEPLTLVALGQGIHKGQRPVTDCLQPSELLLRLRKAIGSHLPETVDAVDVLVDAAEDLLVFRNAISHGRALPLAAGGPSFLNNPTWFGEERKRRSTEAHISDRLLDMALECVSTLTVQGALLQIAILQTSESERKVASDAIALLRTARSIASELRHLSALRNDEHY